MATTSSIQLGKGSLRSGRLAYGCWRIAGTWDPALVTPDKEAEGRAAVRAAFEAGYRLFDLADIYCDGVCERIFGEALQEHPEMRASILVATKCGIRKKGEPKPEAPYRYDFSAAHIARSCEASLQRMALDTIDLYLLHRPDFLCAPDEVAGVFSKLKQAGKVREFGVSNFRPSQVTALQKACPMPLVVNQVEVSLARLEAFQDGTLDQCLAEQITPLAWSPLGGGRLVDGGPIDLQTPDHAHRIHVRSVLESMARERGMSRQLIALAWLLKHPAGMIPIVGSTKPDRIRDALKAIEVDLTREEWYRLMEAARGQRLP
jgi:predicted oxidoreductase